MARARGGGSGSAWALVFFGAGFFICLLLAIVFYTQISGARQAQANAEKRLAEFASPSEQNDPELSGLREGGRSIVGALLEQRNWLREKIANDPNKSNAEIQAAIEALDIGTGSLLQAATQLQNQLAGAKELIGTLEQELAAAQKRAEAAENAKAELDQGYKDAVASLQASLGQATDALEATRKKIDEQKALLEGQLADTRTQYEQQINSLQQQVQGYEDQIADLRKTLAQFTGGGERDPGPGNLTRADGRIVSVVVGRSEVYVNLGKADRLQMGMTFEVFDSSELIKLNDYQRLRGKATLEVVSVDENASVARVVRLDRGRSVTEGDVIANLVYDPEAVYKFYVYGQFDVDGDNQDDHDRIVSMIRQWGGRVADKLSYDVDYLVLGAEPPLPTPPAEGVVDPTEIQRYVVAQREYETYQSLVAEARSPELQIPILNQNRFLALIGYYDR